MVADSGPFDSLNARQQRAILALLSEPTVAKAAEAAAVPQRTLYGWLQDAEFEAAYQLARRQAMRQAVARLQQASAGAVDTLLEVARNAAAPAVARVSASRTILEMALRAVEIEDLDNRLKALEAADAS